ncbi:MAG: putative DNA-binding mobile mystery protein A [Phenylobacterium sp.]|jgi:predicted DNA-binding mobile mystery protein A
MNFKALVIRQYRDIIDTACHNAARLIPPPEGWLRTVRKALKMPSKVIMARAGITKSELYRIERAEVNGTLTLNKLKATANAIGCELHYAVVPKHSIQSMLEQRAYQHARQLVSQANTHMQLEAQGVADEHCELQIQLVAKDLIAEMPSWFWGDNTNGQIKTNR